MQPDIHILNAGLCFQHHTVFHDLNLNIPAGQKLALLGASGIGKTSFVRMLAGLTAKDAAISGQINGSNHLPLSQQIAYMAQKDLLLPWLTTLDNVLLTLKLRHHTVNEKSQKIKLAHDLLREVRLLEASGLYPHQLSNGMRQRAALVRTLLEEKPVVLMDEPFAALDTITRFHMQNLSSKLLREKTVIFITHDPAEALRLADTIYLMHGTPAKIELIATPKGHPPRSLDQATNTALHARLFAQLVQLDQSA